MASIESTLETGSGVSPRIGERLYRVVADHRAFVAVFLVALLLRVAIALGATGLPAQIEDEQHYVALASSLTDGHGFSWEAGRPTSIRPPLYPAFLAAVWSATGSRSLDAIRWAQIPFALAAIVLVYEIGRRWFDRRGALIAAAGLALYPAMLFSGAVLLTETLFTTLLLAFIFCVTRLERRPSAATAAAAGVALGLGALTRSILWPFIVVAVPLVWFTMPAGRRHRAAGVFALVLGYAAVIAPWAVRNTALQGTFTVVDTMGGLNLMMGNYAHTPEDRMWDGVGITGERAWSATLPSAAADGSPWTEGKKDKWAQRQALSYISAHPGTTIRRSVLKFADFWGLERDFVAGVQRGFYRPAGWLLAAGAIVTALAFISAAVAAVIGICFTPPAWHRHVLLLTIVLFFAAVHSVVFGHSRYHLPIVPILLLYGGAAVASCRQLAARRRTRPAIAAAVLVTLLAAIWAHEIFVRDWTRIERLLGGS